MAYQAIFKRYEIKYILTPQQKAAVKEAMAPFMAPDQFGRATIRNIYFDTDNYRLIRHSIEGPAYKEKLRIRSYARAKPGSDVFVELKKKYDHVVYKRRLALPELQAVDWLRGLGHPGLDCQISREIDYFLRYYETLHPTVFLSYEREAYRTLAGDDFRVTFDEHILCRQEALSLEAEVWGESILDEGLTLMEIKTSGGIPLWMTHVLSRERIYKASFSKYGTAYCTHIYPNLQGGFLTYA